MPGLTFRTGFSLVNPFSEKRTIPIMVKTEIWHRVSDCGNRDGTGNRFWRKVDQRPQGKMPACRTAANPDLVIGKAVALLEIFRENEPRGLDAVIAASRPTVFRRKPVFDVERGKTKFTTEEFRYAAPGFPVPRPPATAMYAQHKRRRSVMSVWQI